MIRLVAKTQESGYPGSLHTLDLEGTPSISLNLAVAKPGDVMSRHAPYSQSFRLPYSTQNNQFFAHYYDANLTDGDYDPAKKTEVTLYENGTEVMRGAMQLRGVLLMAEMYEVNIMGEVGDLFGVLGSQLLRDAFTDGDTFITDYDILMTPQNIRDSQDLTQDLTVGQVGAGVVWIPLADHGLQPNGMQMYAGQNIQAGTSYPSGLFAQENDVRADQFKPAIQVKALLDRIISQAGFSYTSSFISSAPFTKLYMTLADATERAVGSQGSPTRVGISANLSVADSEWTNANWDDTDTADGFYDSINVFPGNAFVAVVSGTHYFSAGIIPYSVGGAIGSVRFTLNGESIFTQPYSATAAADEVELTSGPLTLAVGDAVQVQFNSLLVSHVILSAGGGGERTYFRCDQSPIERSVIPQNMPAIKQKDFLADLAQRFNLVLEQDPNNARSLTIEPYPDWIDAGTSQSWSGKLDLDKERKLSPTTTMKSSRITLGDKEGTDIMNVTYQNLLGRVFGEQDQNVDDDFAKGDLTNSPLFAPFFPIKVPNSVSGQHTLLTSVLLPRYYEETETGVKPTQQPPKLFYALAELDIEGFSDTFYIDSTALTSYQFCSPYSDTPAVDSSLALYWNSTDLLPSIGHPLIGDTPPLNNYFREYWSSYLADIYSEESRVLEASIYITPADLRALKFNDRFQILGTSYKLVEVSGYQVGTGESTPCKFLRDIGRESFGSCDSTPTQTNQNGIMTFTNADGTTTTNPGRQCCEAFGYYYDPINSVCRWQVPGDGPPDDGPPVEDALNAGNDIVVPAPTGEGMRFVTIDPGTGATVAVDEFLLTAQTTGATTVNAAPPREGSGIFVGVDTVAHLVIRSNTVNTGGTGGVLYEQEMSTHRAIVNGSTGDFDIVTTSGTTLKTTGAGTRTLDMTFANGQVTLTCDGPTNEITDWSLVVEMVRIYAPAGTENINAILTEAGARLAGSGGRVLLQE